MEARASCTTSEAELLPEWGEGVFPHAYTEPSSFPLACGHTPSYAGPWAKHHLSTVPNGPIHSIMMHILQRRKVRFRQMR